MDQSDGIGRCIDRQIPQMDTIVLAGRKEHFAVCQRDIGRFHAGPRCLQTDQRARMGSHGLHQEGIALKERDATIGVPEEDRLVLERFFHQRR